MDETGKPRGPSDTGERRVREAAERGARDGALEAARHTPPPLTEGRVFEISEQVFDRKMPGHRLQCITDDESGPVCRLTRDIEGKLTDIKREVDDMKEERQQAKGREQARTRLYATVAVLASVVTIAAGLYTIYRSHEARAAQQVPATRALEEVAQELRTLRASLPAKAP